MGAGLGEFGSQVLTQTGLRVLELFFARFVLRLLEPLRKHPAQSE